MYYTVRKVDGYMLTAKDTVKLNTCGSIMIFCPLYYVKAIVDLVVNDQRVVRQFNSDFFISNPKLGFDIISGRGSLFLAQNNI